MQEAKNQLARDGRGDVSGSGEGGTGWKGAMPANGEDGGARKGLASLASRRTFAGANNRIVVLRDELGINRDSSAGSLDDDSSSVVEDAEELAAGAIKGLKTALAALPEPEYEYSVQVKQPKKGAVDDDDENERSEMNGPVDARDQERKRQRMMEEKRKRVLDALPSAVKRNLPDVPTSSLASLIENESDPVRKLIFEEMKRGLASDSAPSVDMAQCPELKEIASTQLDMAWMENSEIWINLWSSPSEVVKPLELFVAARNAAAKVAKESERVKLLAEETIRNEREKGEKAAVEVMNLFKQTKKARMDSELSKWMKHKEEEAVEARLEQLRAEVSSISKAEMELQQQWGEKVALL
jgi:hypothetical protein